MESASKKRKICHEDDHHVDEEDDHDEEEKMEKFYALVKNIREARDRLMINSNLKIPKNNEAAANDDDERGSKKRKLEEVERQVAVWKPCFRREDFMEDTHQLMKKPLPAFSLASASQSKEGTSDDQKEVVKEELDLSLSL